MEKYLLIAVTLGVWASYFPLNRRQSRHSFKIRLDDFVPLISLSVWPYAIFFPYIFLTPIVLWQQATFITYTSATIIAGSLAGLIWYLFPNGVKRPKLLTPRFLSQKILSRIYKYDHDTNGLPSGHVFYSVVTTYFLAQAYPQIAAVLWILTIAVIISAVTTNNIIWPMFWAV